MKKILITGSTDGIGKLAAIKLAKAGHHICLHGRSQDKLSNAIEEVKGQSGNEHVSGFLADFSDLTEVRKMAGEVRVALSSLDVLINNAGVYNSHTATTAAGLDIRMVVNYLAPYLLTEELMPLLDKDARILNLASAAQASVDFDLLSGEKPASAGDAYAQSKLALIMWSFHLAQTQKDKTVIAVNPGSLLQTKMVMEAFGKSWSSADKGAEILYDLAVSQEYNERSGEYYDNDTGGFNHAHAEAYDKLKTDKLIARTRDLAGLG